MWGHPVDADAIRSLCDRHGLRWVEDCSHAHFAEYIGRRVGSFGDASVLSLQGNKLLTGGEGGILLTDSQEVYERATLLGHSLKRSEDCVTNPHWRDILRTGFGLKFRIHPLAAVMVLHLLENYCFSWIESRSNVLRYFSDGLEGTGVISPMTRRDYVTSMGAHYGFKPRIDFSALGIERNTFVRAVAAEGVDVTVPGSPPFHRLALFDSNRFPIGTFEKADNSERSFPGADAYYDSIISLPTFTFSEDLPLVDAYIGAFRKVLDNLEELKA
jgi:dTDP-4-amino-4,6-dideoxygalactose transaminase